MKPIGEFLSERLSRALPAPKGVDTSEAKGGALMVLRDAVPTVEAEQLAGSLERFAASQEFAAAANDAIPPPRLGESEDEFVERAKAALQALLLAKFVR